MNLRGKLSRLDGRGIGGPSNTVTPLGRAAAAFKPSAGDTGSSDPRSALAPRLETAHGLLHLHDRTFAPNARHGRALLSAAREVEGETLAALALNRSLGDVPLGGMLLLDTETTGLAGGTGTLAFVVGLGWFEAGALRLVQLIVPGFVDEAPMLSWLRERIEQASCLVTYNGKTFDWPLLRSRFVMNRLKPPEPKPHLDLLHCARRVYRHRGGGARLVQLEREVIGHERVGDIPGEEIPERYFRFLRTGEAGLIAPVIEHNAQDILLLAALLGHMGAQYRSATAEDARDCLGYATVAARAGDGVRAEALARLARERGEPMLRAQALVLLAECARRRGAIRESAELLEDALLIHRPSTGARVHLQLAKLYEHRCRDPVRALEHARRACGAEAPEVNSRRLARLEGKIPLSAEQILLNPVQRLPLLEAT